MPLTLTALRQITSLQQDAFALTIAGGSLRCEQVLRCLPGRRLVCRATCKGQTVLAKLFIHPGKADRDSLAELNGYRYLQQANITTPRLIENGNLDGDGRYLLFEFLHGATSLPDTWQTEPHRLPEDYRALLPIVGQMHRHQIQQIDLHTGNFLRHQGTLYTIDCADVQPLAHRPGQAMQQRTRNLADLLSQLPVQHDPLLPELLQLYNQHSEIPAIPLSALCLAIQRWRHWRLAHYQKKIRRTCTEFVASHWKSGWFKVQLRCKRSHSDAQWRAFYATLDQHIESGQRLKSGNTATVSLATHQHQAVVIKRYNIKHWRHFLSRCWRPSRAWHTWENAHQLSVLGIATPSPIAVLEYRLFGLRHKAYYLCAYNPARDALSEYTSQKHLHSTHHKAFVDFFTALQSGQISHGDLKANNLLLDGERISVIDLDSMRFHHQQASFQRAFAKDLTRFMRNWTGYTEIEQQFATLLAALPKQTVCQARSRIE